MVGEARFDALCHRSSYFEELYAADPDPWSFDSSWYEHRKRQLTIAALPRARYRRALEPGCSIGALSELLAERCDELIAHDIIPSAVDAARRRVDRSHVTVLQAAYPAFWPVGTGDLVVWSEVAYYLTDVGRELAMRGLDRWLEPDGHLVAVHYTAETDYPQRGDAIAPWIDDQPWLRRVTRLGDPRFELGVWERRR